MKDPQIQRQVRRQSQGHKWGAQLRREFDTLIRATEGLGASALFEALATEAIIADDGTLADSTGRIGYAWDPAAQVRRGASNPAAARVKASGASLGAIIAGGHPQHRTYLAFLQAIYVVTTQQDYDVAARIEMLWDQMAYDEPDELQEEETPPAPRKRSWVGRLIDRFVRWWHYGGEVPR